MNEVVGVEGAKAGATILVEFAPRAGLKDVTSKPAALAERSAAALDAAMTSIQEFADRISVTVNSLMSKPEEAEVEFGLKLDAEAGALIAKTKMEAHIVVTLKWARDKGEGDEDRKPA
jgi:Trypsin-co-occurring domain 1